MASELYTLLFAATAAGTVQPLTLWKSIKLAKQMLEFVGECPEWINYNKNLEENLQCLKRKVECLEGVRADVTTQLDNTELQSGKKRKREVDHWLKCVKRKAVDVKKVENGINSVSYLPRFLFRAWLGSCIRKEVEQLTELQEQGKFPEGLLLDAPLDGGEPLVTSVLVGQGVVAKIDKVWSHLVNPRTTKIGVHGPEGIGKSAIMTEIYNRLCSSCRVYYVNVPQNCTTFRLQAAISSVMRVKLPKAEGSENRRAARIFQVLVSVKEFVLILDGLSQDFALEHVGIPMEGIGGKLILTSRLSDVCRRMSCQQTILLDALSREDSEMLFINKLAAEAPLSDEIRDVAGAIVSKCRGVPSRIINMAVQLRGVSDINEWKNTLNEM